ncbi:hypothetical protein NM208_g13603 [Fusarium decemcellulare]|uniref:Uncharacterized protein n=1 Tax=Fusarium decemcellulare TaxID=57161 RepID=A0ACC1RL58_9HYPO|nr:hypothetical protein NM208_g13603 [Fusarium decemcellulare]
MNGPIEISSDSDSDDESFSSKKDIRPGSSPSPIPYPFLTTNTTGRVAVHNTTFIKREEDDEEDEEEEEKPQLDDKPTQGEPQRIPCRGCIQNMILLGPGHLCYSQLNKPGNTTLYLCTRSMLANPVSFISKHLFLSLQANARHYACRLQAMASCKVEGWNKLVRDTRNALREPSRKGPLGHRTRTTQYAYTNHPQSISSGFEQAKTAIYAPLMSPPASTPSSEQLATYFNRMNELLAQSNNNMVALVNRYDTLIELHRGPFFEQTIPPYEEEDDDFEDPGVSVGSDTTENTEPPAKRSKRNPIAGENREIPCAKCITRMHNNGPSDLCKFQASAYPTTACYGCAKVPENAKPHGRILQEAAKLFGRGELVHNWDQLARCALTAVQQAERDSSFMPDPPKAIQRDPGLSPHVPQPPGHDLPHQAFSGNEIAALVTRNNELVAKTNQLLKDLLEKVSVPNNGGFLPPWG